MVVDAVQSEPVSVLFSLITGKKQGKTARTGRFGLNWAISARIHSTNTVSYAPLPCS